jgi:hypothetical protein
MATQNNNGSSSDIPEESSTKPMDSKKDVEQSPDQKTDQDFPGYPHYPAKEDIMEQGTENHRVDVDVENIPNSNNKTGVSQRYAGTGSAHEGGEESGAPSSIENDPELNPRTDVVSDSLEATGSEEDEIGLPQNVDNDDLLVDENDEEDSNVTDSERQALQDSEFMLTSDESNLRNARMDDTDFDGEKLNEESFGDRLTSAGLDIPDEGDETDREALGQGDEENKYYSLGGDRHEAQEEDPYSGPQRG